MMTRKILLFLAFGAALVLELRAGTFVVTHAGDSGPGSLREAIHGANGNPGPDTIAFNIAGAGPHVIEPNSQLPDITGDGTIVDGMSQPGYAGTPRIILSGWNFGIDIITCYRGSGLIIRGNDCIVRGLLLIRFANRPDQRCDSNLWRYDTHTALRLEGARGRVHYCLFGTDPDGLVRTFNGLPTWNGRDVLIRGSQNVVEDCTLSALTVGDGSATDNLVRRCDVGFRRDGRLFPDQSSAGAIGVFSGTRNRIGQPGAGNRVVSIQVGGNSIIGVPYSTTVQGNTIGLAVDGGVAPGSWTGVTINGETYDTLVGGLGPGEGNLIVGTSASTGIRISSGVNSFGDVFYSRRARIEGNELRGLSKGVVVYSKIAGEPDAKTALVSNLIRDCDTGIIAYTDASIFGNRFPGTRLNAISLERGTVANPPNDPFDLDDGPNGFQNTPVIESVRYDSARDRTIVEGRLQSAPARLYRIELYSSSPAPGRPAGGDVTQGTVEITTDIAGGAPFRFELPGVYADRVFTALASDITAGGLTSPMSAGFRPPVGSFTLLPAVAVVTESGTSALLRIRRNGGSYGPASVRLAVDGTIAASADLRFLYSSVSATPPVVSFASGETEQFVDLFAFDDALNEAGETFAITLTQPTGGASVTAAETVVLVTDNDPRPAFSVNDIVVNEDVGLAQFTVSLSAPSGRTTQVSITTQPGTAVVPDDFSNGASILTFAPGETAKPVVVPIVDSFGIREFEEYFYVRLFSPVEATISDDAGVATILDLDGSPPTTTGFRFFTEPFSTPEGGFLGQAFVTVQRTGSLVGSGSVRISTDFFNASAADVVPLDNELIVFADGEQFRVVTLTLTDDALDEADEQLVLRLSDPVGPAGGSLDPAAFSLSVTLQDDDALPTVSLGSASQLEGDDGVTTVEMPLSLSVPSGRDIGVWLTVAGGSAGPTDFANTWSVIIPAGAMTATIPVEIFGDVANEADETVQFLPATLEGHPVLGEKLLILNDDPVEATFRLEGVPVVVSETVGEFFVTLRRVGDISGTDVCRIKFLPESASIRLDDTEFTFLPGETTALVRVTVRDDGMDEPDEVIRLSLQPQAPAVAAAPGIWEILIIDDDAPPVLSIGDSLSVIERDGDSVTARIYLRLSGPSGFLIRALGVQTVAGTAAAGSDFAAIAPNDVSFPPGTTEVALDVTILGDRLDETDETFFVFVSGADAASLGTSEVAVTVQDNDTPQRGYRDWLTGHFTPAERRTDMTDPCADPDGDRLSNGLEYFLDSNPRSAASGPDRFVLFRGSSDLVWTWTGLRSRDAFASPLIDVSSDLISWTLLDPGHVTVFDSDPDGRQYKVLLPYDSHPQRFLKLKSACPPFEPDGP